MRIGVLMVEHPPERISPVMPAMIGHLRAWGCHVDVLLPDEDVVDVATLRPQHDVYVLKSGTEAALSVAGALHAQGAFLVNDFPVTALCRDKVRTTRALQAAGLPVPSTWVTTHPGRLAPLLADGPLVVKPVRGSQGRGVAVARSAAELPAAGSDVMLAQRFHAPDGPDLKLYCIGEQVFGVRRSWPARTYAEKVGVPLAVDPALRDMVLASGQALGLSLFGVDVVESGGERYVVDLSAFPGFKGVPDAGLRLADHVYHRARSSGAPTGRALRRTAS